MQKLTIFSKLANFAFAITVGISVGFTNIIENGRAEIPTAEAANLCRQFVEDRNKFRGFLTRKKARYGAVVKTPGGVKWFGGSGCGYAWDTRTLKHAINRAVSECQERATNVKDKCKVIYTIKR